MKTRNVNSKSWDFPRYTFYIFLVFIFGLFIKFVYLSISPSIYGKDMSFFAENRNTISSTLYAKRGSIFDRNGNALALNVSSYTVVAYLSSTRTGSDSIPRHVIDKELTAEKLAPILNMSKEYILSLLNRTAYQVELGPGGRGITELTKEAIEELNLPGIGFVEEQKRYYPNGSFASYILGYAKRQDDGSIVGELGIEDKYDLELKGKDGYTMYQQDVYGYKIPDTPETTVESVDGNDIYLTLDSTIQRFVEEAVLEMTRDYSPDWITFTAMDAKTGKILGSSSSPSFDPNILNITNYENPLVSVPFEPGSTMKTYTYMCAIDLGKYNGNDTYLSGTYNIYGTTISDWDGKGWGTITYDKGYEYSSNVAVTNLMNSVLTKEELKACFEKYGFGSATGIELTREQSGSLNFNYPIEVASASFGQGIFTTPIQHLQGLSIISNNGKMLKPKIIEKIIDKSTGDVVYEYEKEESEQLVSLNTVNKMKELMYNVVNGTDIGTTGTAYRVKGVDVIGKTGTAQYFISETNQYSSGGNNYIYSFSGMFPKENPEIILYAAVKKPKGSGGISRMVRNTIENIVKYLNLEEEDTSNDLATYLTESYINKDVDDIKRKLEDLDLKVILLGDGEKIISQSHKVGETLLEGDRIILKTNGANITMPNIVNWSRKDTQYLCELTGISCTYDGFGYVTNQSIKPRTIIDKNSVLEVKLESSIG